MIGESPTRPGIFHERPLVVVTDEMSPRAFTAFMPTLGVDEYDPVLKAKVTSATGGLTDQQIADIVAYLTALK